MNEKEIINKLFEGTKSIIVSGNLGSGKSTCCIYPLINKSIKNRENFIIIDKKAEYYTKYYEILKNNNYSIKVLNLNEANKSDAWNPLLSAYEQYKNKKIDKCLNLLISLVNSLTNNKYEINTIIGTILLLFIEGQEDEISLYNVYRIISLISNDEKIICNYLNKNYNENIDYCFRSIICLPKETRKEYLANSLQIIASIICIPNVKYLTSISKNKEAKLKTATFIIPNKMNDDINVLVNLFINDTCSAKINVYTNIIIDDINDNIILDNLISLISNSQFNNIKFILGTKSLNNTLDIYSEELKNICDSINVTKESMSYDLDLKHGEIKREWKVDELETPDAKYPELENKDIKKIDLNLIINA